MRVGLDLLYLVPGQTGGRETYARELVPAMLERSPELELVAFVNRDAGAGLAAELGEGVRAVVVPVSARSRPQWALGELVLVSLAARRARVDVLHSMANFAPAWGAFRRVVTIHDLQYRALPEMLAPRARAATEGMIRLAARRADRVITGSDTTAREIVEGLGVDAARVDVIPHGSGATPKAEPLAETELRRRLDLVDRPVILCPASNLPHKNLTVLFQTLALMEPVQRPVLVLAGHGTDGAALRAQAHTAGVAENVRGLGSVSAGELDGLYALASCVVLPTLYEGFRPSRARGDGARCAGRMLGSACAARGGRLGSPVLQPARTRRDRRKGQPDAHRRRLGRDAASARQRPGGRLQLGGRRRCDAGELSPGAGGITVG